MTTADQMLPLERRSYGIARAIFATIPEENRWYLPFRRYTAQIGERVTALGGDTGHDGGDTGHDGDGDDGGPRRGCSGCIGLIVHLLGRLFRRRRVT